MTEPLAGAWSAIHMALWEKLGYNTRAMLDRLALADQRVGRNRIPVSLELRGMLFNELARDYDDPVLGLRTGALYNPLEMGVLGYAIMTSPTIGAALQVCSRYFCLYSDLVRFDLVVEGTIARFVLTPEEHYTYSRHQLEAIVAGFAHFPIVIRQGFSGLGRVTFSYPPPCAASEYERILGCPVLFNQPVTALQFPAALLTLRLTTADESLHALHTGIAEQKLQETLQAFPLREEIRRRLANLLKAGTPFSMAKLSAQMHTSTRNLQLRLQKEGDSYRKIIGDIRMELALQLVASPDVPLQDIHYLLGYSEHSTFYQAFKRWTGSTPGAYRQTQLADSESRLSDGRSGKV